MSRVTFGPLAANHIALWPLGTHERTRIQAPAGPSRLGRREGQGHSGSLTRCLAPVHSVCRSGGLAENADLQRIVVSKMNWRPVGLVDHGRLREARFEVHHAVQWLARAARAYVPPQPDDSHSNFGWDDAFGGFTTHALAGDVRLGLKMIDLALVVANREGDGSEAAFPLRGKADVDARGWLQAQLAARGLNPRGLDAPPPYGIPAHPIAEGAAYRVSEMADALAELAAWFANAHSSLGGIRDQMIAQGLTTSPVRCWPHHFDIATLISFDRVGNAGPARSVNVGLSPGDEYYDEPYFYVSPYPYPDAARLPHLPAIGHWHVQGFTAAITPANRILGARNRQSETEAFLSDAVEASFKALS